MLIASLLFGISASLDALLVGISYGIRGIRIRFWQNLTISLITLLGTCLSVGLGRHLASILPEFIGNYAGSLVLMGLGIYYIFKWTRTRQKASPSAEGPCLVYTAGPCAAAQPVLRLSEVLTLSLTLSLNNLSAGLSASLAGMPLLPAAGSTLACSVLFLLLGNCLGVSSLLQLAGQIAEPLSGILLIGLGIVQFFL